MKKILSFFLALLFLVSVFTGCKDTPPSNTDDTTDSQDLTSDSESTEKPIEEFISSDFKCATNKDNGITILQYLGSDPHLVIPQTIDGKNVTRIGAWSFYRNSSLISVTIPDSVRVIENVAFFYATSLTSVTLSQNLISIGDYAFARCSGLSDITLPETLKELGDCAFGYCSSLKHIRIPSSLTDWGAGAFMFSALETVDLAEGLQVIGNSAFFSTDIKNVVLPSSMKELQERAFSSSPLESITLNEGLISIGLATFNQNDFSEIVIPSTVKYLDAYAFAWSSVKKIKFEGNAPEIIINENPEIKNRYEWASKDILCFHQEAEGFTLPEWNGYPTEIW